MTRCLSTSGLGRAALTAALAMVLIALAGCASKENVVVVYSSQDQVFAEPIFREFTRQTGIEVRPVFDTESAKTAGLANRLRLERSNPQCDVFWSNEELHARLLLEEGVLSSNGWRTVGYRTRRIVLNTNQLAGMAAPKNLLELTNAAWRGKFAMAYPLFGTTGLHLQALRQSWGEPLWKQWCEGVVRNGAKIVDGNSMVVKLVGNGEVVLGLTDSDDVAAGQAQGFPIRALDPGPEMLAIPNTVALVQGAPRPLYAEALGAFLAKPETLHILVAAHALESASFEAAPTGLLKMRWSETTQAMKDAATFLQQLFVRS